MTDTTEYANVIEHKCVSVNGFKTLIEEGDGVVSTIVSVTGLQDNVKDVIEPGAYTKSLATRTPKGVWHHQWTEPVSKTLDVKELMPGDPELPETLPNGEPWPSNAGGLKIKTQFNLNTQRGRDAYEDVIFYADEQEWSIGYQVPLGGATVDKKTGVRHIKQLELYEYSPVLFGAMPAARTSSVKEAQMAYKSLNQAVVAEDIDPAEFEDALNEDVVDEDEDFGEKSGFYPTPDEGRVYGYFEDGVFTKAQVAVSSMQARKLQRAITSMLDLLRESNVADETDGFDSANPSKLDPSSTSMSQLVAKVFGSDANMTGAATDFDNALDKQDAEALEPAAETIVSAVETAIDQGDDESKYAAIGRYLTWALNQAATWEEDAADGGADDSTEEDPNAGDAAPDAQTGGSGTKAEAMDEFEAKVLLAEVHSLLE